MLSVASWASLREACMSSQALFVTTKDRFTKTNERGDQMHKPEEDEVASQANPEEDCYTHDHAHGQDHKHFFNDFKYQVSTGVV